VSAKPFKYKTISEMHSVSLSKDDLPFLKRSLYSDECEFRLFSAPSKSKNGVLRLAIPKITVSQISLSPWLLKSVVTHVKQLLKGITHA